MSVIRLEDLDVVKLKDGKTGTVVLVYDPGKAACIELSGEPQGQLIDITLDDVEAIIWKSKDHH